MSSLRSFTVPGTAGQSKAGQRIRADGEAYQRQREAAATAATAATAAPAAREPVAVDAAPTTRLWVLPTVPDSWKRIILKVAKNYATSPSEIFHRCRRREIITARGEIFYLIAMLPGSTQSSIGSHFGWDHSSIRHLILRHISANPGLPKPYCFETPVGRHSEAAISAVMRRILA